MKANEQYSGYPPIRLSGEKRVLCVTWRAGESQMRKMSCPPRDICHSEALRPDLGAQALLREPAKQELVETRQETSLQLTLFLLLSNLETALPSEPESLSAIK